MDVEGIGKKEPGPGNRIPGSALPYDVTHHAPLCHRDVPGKGSPGLFEGFGIENYVKELIPHIDKTYRTIARREGRCIEGFSMGGRGSTRLVMKYPEMFCSLFCQAGNVPRIVEGYDPSSPDSYPNYYLGPDKQNYIDNDAFLLLEKNLEEIKKVRILIACGTQDDGHIVTIRDFHQALLDKGVDHTYWELEGLKHERRKFIELLSPILYDYHVESLRRAGVIE